MTCSFEFDPIKFDLLHDLPWLFTFSLNDDVRMMDGKRQVEQGMNWMLAFPVLPSGISQSDQGRPDSRPSRHRATKHLPQTHTPWLKLSSSVHHLSLTSPRPFTPILRGSISPCFPAKSNHVSLSTPWSWLTNTFSSKGQIPRKSRLLSDAIRPLPVHAGTKCLLLLFLLFLPQGCCFSLKKSLFRSTSVQPSPQVCR